MTRRGSSTSLDKKQQLMFDAFVTMFEKSIGPKLSALREKLLQDRDERTVRKQRREREREPIRDLEKLEYVHHGSLSSRTRRREMPRQVKDPREERGEFKLRKTSCLSSYDPNPYLGLDKKAERGQKSLEVYHRGPSSSNQRSQDRPRRASSPRGPKEELGRLHKSSHQGEHGYEGDLEGKRMDKLKKENKVKEAEIHESKLKEAKIEQLKTKGSKTKASEIKVVCVEKGTSKIKEGE